MISSTATTRPKSLGYVFTNLGVGGNIMGEKRNGELGLIEAYKKQQESSSSSSPSYTIIRPGGLEEPKRNKVLGPSVLEISQGDVFSGIISRADVAEITVELALSEAPNVKNTAVELYYTDSVVPVENRFKSLLKSSSEGEQRSNLRLHGRTYSELFQGIQSNVDFTE
uniref:NAD(P)-binding domain-containing protein n=2 Tax=Pseudo-nitzschia australis TaxID=44445 RepID=A0A7S4EKW8_9STRA|mmetsp:Transcript_20131/g.42593  ORF Transcript_20131/g.42593 Transcript_20131/m.42593 type:complete len:168 (-) Transcript_20131:349-852(-)